jgi:hypothetical protein
MLEIINIVKKSNDIIKQIIFSKNYFLQISSKFVFRLYSFVVDMRKGTYRQKCHDTDCKAFQGIERLLPKNVAPWLMMLDEEF